MYPSLPPIIIPNTQINYQDHQNSVDAICLKLYLLTDVDLIILFAYIHPITYS